MATRIALERMGAWDFTNKDVCTHKSKIHWIIQSFYNKYIWHWETFQVGDRQRFMERSWCMWHQCSLSNRGFLWFCVPAFSTELLGSGTESVLQGISSGNWASSQMYRAVYHKPLYCSSMLRRWLTYVLQALRSHTNQSSNSNVMDDTHTRTESSWLCDFVAEQQFVNWLLKFLPEREKWYWKITKPRLEGQQLECLEQQMKASCEKHLTESPALH